MAEFDPEQLAQILVSRGGYNPTDARNAAFNSGGRASQLAREFGLVSTTPSTSGISVGGADPLQMAKQVQQFQVEANQPAIQTLESQKEPLKQRYAQIIADIKGQQGVATKKAEVATAREFGKRGVPLSSGVYDTALSEATTPINTQYGGLLTQAQSSQEQDLMSLASQIAQLQAGNAPQALSTAQNLITLQQQAEKLNQKEANTEIVTAGGRKLLIDKTTGNVVSDLGSSSESSGGLSADVLMAILGGGQLTNTPKEPKPTTKPTSPSTSKYNAGGNYYG